MTEKELAAAASMSYVEDGKVVGLGTGSTATLAIGMLAERVRAGLRIRAVPTSRRTEELARSLGIPLVTFEDVGAIDVTIDGTDEFDPQLDLIKGAGGALLREKIVASASRQLVIVADSSKRVDRLGARALPIEVIPFAEALVARRIAELGATVASRRDYVTDEGHHILDCSFGAIADAAALARTLDAIPGVVEHGLFIGIASVVVVATGDNVEFIPRAAPR
jgi:ribose 5-phosphate isomerase A